MNDCMCGDDVRAAAGAALSFLEPRVDRDWSVPVPGLDFTVASVLAHAGQGPLWYVLDLVGGPEDDAAFEIGVRPDAGPRALLRSLRTAAHLGATTVDGLPATARGFHPCGAADPSGFAAMACDEILVHTHDAATGLGEDFRPDQSLARRVLARLFPRQAPGADAWATLLWAHGRLDLPNAPRPRDWRWHSAPVAGGDGDGATPRGA
ncbi:MULTISPECIES: maleylpyruvate isomerase N-terminal domain-containing protein [Streptomyces]|nr:MULTISPECIES: maleylpyruvate isomerase N-terminal domain-containing protein [Streptomyces]